MIQPCPGGPEHACALNNDLYAKTMGGAWLASTFQSAAPAAIGGQSLARQSAGDRHARKYGCTETFRLRRTQKADSHIVVDQTGSLGFDLDRAIIQCARGGAHDQRAETLIEIRIKDYEGVAAWAESGGNLAVAKLFRLAAHQLRTTGKRTPSVRRQIKALIPS